MRKLLILCGLILLVASSAKAQDGKGFEITCNYRTFVSTQATGVSGKPARVARSARVISLPSLASSSRFARVRSRPASGSSAHGWLTFFGPRVYFHAHGRVYPFFSRLSSRRRFSAGFTVWLGSTNAFATAWRR